MALSIATITFIVGTFRDAQASAYKTAQDAGTTSTLRLSNRTIAGGTVDAVGTLADILMDATAAFTGPSAGNGLLTADVSPALSGTATGGTATAVNTWELLTDSTVLLRGTVTGSDTITSGQTVNLTSLTLTWPAS